MLAEAATEIDDVRIALQELRGALQAQVDAAAIDPELLRRRSSELRSGLEAFRRRLSPPPRHPRLPKKDLVPLPLGRYCDAARILTNRYRISM